MRWMWIDRVVSLTSREEIVAIKHISMAEDHLHDQAGAGGPVMPATLIIEGMAQAAGVLVGHCSQFREKVVLAKISRAQFDVDARPGATLWYTARIVSMDEKGAATSGLVEIQQPGSERQRMGQIELIFSHLDHSNAGLELPEHNFVFGESFQTLLRMSGIA
jgi:3-hydroxyacyl-[acyl-carrier-protein] dehydratase